MTAHDKVEYMAVGALLTSGKKLPMDFDEVADMVDALRTRCGFQDETDMQALMKALVGRHLVKKAGK